MSADANKTSNSTSKDYYYHLSLGSHVTWLRSDGITWTDGTPGVSTKSDKVMLSASNIEEIAKRAGVKDTSKITNVTVETYLNEKGSKIPEWKSDHFFAWPTVKNGMKNMSEETFFENYRNTSHKT